MAQVSIVVPLHNDEFEGLLFVRSLVEASAHLQGWEVILVDSGSTDGTLSKMHELVAKNAQIKMIYYAQDWGVGHAVHEGIFKSEGEKVIILDPKNVFSSKTIEEIISKLDSVDVVFGKRSEPDFFLGKIFVSIFSFFASSFFGKKSDYFCSTHGFRKEAARVLFKDMLMRCDLFPLELVYKIQKGGFSSVEVLASGTHGNINKYSFKEKIKFSWRLFLLWVKLLRA